MVCSPREEAEWEQRAKGTAMAEADRGTTTAASGATFGALVRRYRLAAALSQEALAERAGLSADAISVIERGKRGPPRLETVGLLAVGLGLPSEARAAFIAASRDTSGSTALSRPPTDRHAPPALEEPPFVGRTVDLALLERHLAGEGPPVLLLAGEPGIGKSRLLGGAMTCALRNGWTVLHGGCQRRSGQEPYAPLLGSLKGYVRRQAPTQLQADLHGCAWLVRLLPELADGPIESLPAWTLPLEQERRLMFEAVHRFLTNISGRAGTLLVLDDLQWAEPDALELLATVVRATAAPVRVIGAYRDTEVRPRDPLAVTLADLAHAGLAAQHMLAPLTPPDCARLLAALLPEGRTAPDSTVQAALRERVLRRAGGVPFFMVSCVQEWRAGLLGSGAADAAPWTVAQSVRQRVAALPDGAREVLDAAALAGRAVPAAVLLAVATQPQDEVLAALEAACQARLLVDEEQGYRFAHDVIREVLEGDIGSARRLLVHGRIAHALEHGDVQQVDVEVLAYHYSRSGEHDKALLYLEQAGDRARDRYAHETAAAYYREVATRQDRLGRAHAAARMREQAGVMQLTAGQYEPALALLEQVAVAYDAADDLEGLGRAVASIGNLHLLAGTPAPLQRLEQTLARLEVLGVGQGVTVLCARLSEIYHDVGRYDDQLAAAERAVAGARRLGDDRLLADALGARAWALCCRGRPEDALPDLEEARRLAEITGQLDILCGALHTAGWVYGDRGEVERPRAYSDRAVATAERLGDPAVLVLMLAIRSVLAFFHGDWRQARADCERALVASRGSASRLQTAHRTMRHRGPMSVDDLTPPTSAAPPRCAAEWLGRLYLGQLCLAEGNLQEAAHHLEAALTAVPDGDVHDVLLVQSLLAHLDLLSGRPVAAHARLAPLAAQPGPREGWEWQVTPLLVLLAWAHLDLDEVAQAATVAAQAVAQARAGQLPRALVEALWMQARVATRQQCWAQVRRALDEGVALARRMRYPYGEARLLHVYGTLHVQQADPDRARRWLEAALVIFRRLGACIDAERVEQDMIALGDIVTS